MKSKKKAIEEYVDQSEVQQIDEDVFVVRKGKRFDISIVFERDNKDDKNKNK